MELLDIFFGGESEIIFKAFCKIRRAVKAGF